MIENNVSVDNGLTHPATQGDVRVDGAASAGVVVDYNLVYLTSPGVLYAWGSKQYGSQAALRAAVPGVEAHGLQADPRWVAPGSGNFSLRAGSPAINSADSGASGASTFDAQQHRRFDDPGTPNTGAGPRTFDDRGALEFR